MSVTQEDLWNQAANQINVVSNLAAMENQSDLISFALRSLATDIQNSGVKLSQQTLDAINVLNQIAASSSTTYTNVQNFVATPSNDAIISRVIGMKSKTRDLQSKYYAKKSQLGI